MKNKDKEMFLKQIIDNNSNEVWKDITGFESLYKNNNTGNTINTKTISFTEIKLTQDELNKIEQLWNCKIHKIWYEFGARVNKNGKILKTVRNMCRIFFTNETNIKRQLASWRLECILGRRLNTIRDGSGIETVDHIDGNPINDYPENLQLLNMNENAKKDYNHEGYKPGEQSINAKLLETDVKYILNLYYIDKKTITEIANLFNDKISYGGIKSIIYRKNWTDTIRYKIPDFFIGKVSRPVDLSNKDIYFMNIGNRNVILYPGLITFIDNEEFIFIGASRFFPTHKNYIYIDDLGRVIKCIISDKLKSDKYTYNPNNLDNYKLKLSDFNNFSDNMKLIMSKSKLFKYEKPKLNEEDVKRILRLYMIDGVSTKDISKIFSEICSREAIKAILQRRNWKHIPIPTK